MGAIILIVEDGTGLATANSYVSIEDADTYFSNRGETLWTEPSATVGLTFDTQPTDGDTFTLDSKTYTMETSLSDVDGNIFIGASLAATQQNILDAVNLTGDAGTQYASTMTLHPTISAGTSWTSDVLTLTSKASGFGGNSYASTETFTADTNVFGSLTLLGGLDDKAESLLESTQFLDLRFGAKLEGIRRTKDQRLSWPRSGLSDRDGYSISDTSLPRNLQEACYEGALRNLTDTDGLIPDEDGGSISEESVTLGPIKESVKYSSSKPASTRFKIVDYLMMAFLRPSGIMQRG